MMTDGEEAVAGFTNPRGVWNKYSGTWDVTPGRVWNGQFWYEPKKNLKNVLPRTRLGQADGREEAGQGTENKGSISYLQYRRVGCKTAEEEDEDSCAADESTDQINGRVVDSSTAANAAWVPRNEEVLKERREGVTAQENGKPAQHQREQHQGTTVVRKDDGSDEEQVINEDEGVVTRVVGPQRSGLRDQHQVSTVTRHEANEVVPETMLTGYTKKLEEIWSLMTTDAWEKDGERAALYVATVRPAMAAARYVRADSLSMQDTETADANDTANVSNKDEGRSEEGAHLKWIEEARSTEDALDDEGTTTVEVLTDEGDKGTSHSIAQIRQTRKLVQNQKKRQRFKRALEKRRTAAREEEQQRDDEEQRRRQRQQHADEAIRRLEAC
ncbi:hypothetical protein PC116_g19020 [Phytophthora cactorum]|nr:hypothetical protein PC116_g19020 [Phytophthora cactorum]